jgi:hypothetical protein
MITLVPEVYFSSPLRNENNKNKSLEPGYLKERYVKKCAKDICGSELCTLVVSFCSKHNIFSKIITTR